jgi:molybdate transport system regulatory protein
MQASARNQLFGSVKDVVLGAVNSEVVIALGGGDELVAAVTNKSVESLGITAGKEVVALIKAPQIIVVKDFGGYRLSARNQLNGTVEHIQKGAVNSDVVIKLDGGNTIAATVTNESVDTLGLKAGDAAAAVFKAGAVILGIK